MPSQQILEQKKQIVASLVDKLKNSSAGVLVDYKGITVEDDTKLRKELREAGVHYGVYKNTLIKFAMDEIGFSELDHVLNGTTAVAFSEGLTAGARILCEFAKKHDNFSVKGGYVEGKAMDAEGVQMLASLPSKEVLIAQVLAGFNAPISGFANVLNGNLRGLVVALNAIREKQEKQAS